MEDIVSGGNYWGWSLPQESVEHSLMSRMETQSCTREWQRKERGQREKEDANHTQQQEFLWAYPMLGNAGEPARDFPCPCPQGTHRLGESGVGCRE